MSRRRAGPTSAQRRHERNMSRMAVDRQREHVYTRCWICNAEFVVNNYSDLKVRVKEHEIAGQLVCSTCRCVINGKVVTRAGLDWARRFMQMYVLARKSAELACERELVLVDDGDDHCKCVPCTADRLVREIEIERPPRRLYRKRRAQAQEV